MSRSGQCSIEYTLYLLSRQEAEEQEATQIIEVLKKIEAEARAILDHAWAHRPAHDRDLGGPTLSYGAGESLRVISVTSGEGSSMSPIWSTSTWTTSATRSSADSSFPAGFLSCGGASFHARSFCNNSA